MAFSNGRVRLTNQLNPIYGSTDGIGAVVDAQGATNVHDGLIMVSNGDICGVADRSMWVEHFVDFNGPLVIADIDSLGTSNAGPWAIQSTGTSPTLARKADHDNGAYEIQTSSTSEVADLTLYWGDELNLDSDLGPIMKIRCQVQTAPAAADSICWGFASARNAIQDTVANNAWFKLAGANTDLLIESDDATTNDDDNDTTVNLTAGTYAEFMISMNPIHGASATDVRFFYRATLGGAWTRQLPNTTFAFGAATNCQPYVQVEKTSGATTPDLLVDYIHVMQKRTA